MEEMKTVFTDQIHINVLRASIAQRDLPIWSHVQTVGGPLMWERRQKETVSHVREDSSANYLPCTPIELPMDLTLGEGATKTSLLMN